MARPRAWHAVSAAEALAALGSDVNGLGDTEARQRLDAHGANRLPGSSRKAGSGAFSRSSAIRSSTRCW